MKKLPCLALSFLCLFLYNKGARSETLPSSSARSAILIELVTGRVLYEHNVHEALPMASTTKVMTALLALENAGLDDAVTAGRNAFGVSGTSIYLQEGETLTMQQMLYGLMLASGNDAAVAIAEHVGGTVDDFCAMMTARAAELGCENTVFKTPHGLPNAQHHTTAHDLARIAQKAMAQPAFREIVSTARATIPWQGRTYDRVLYNKNQLLSTYPGAMGVKTGYTKAAGRCLVFCAQRDGLCVLGVVLNCADWFAEAARIMDLGFANYHMPVMLDKGEAVRALSVKDGTSETVTVIAGETLAAPMKKGGYPDIVIDLPEQIASGVRAGEALGSASLVDNGETLCTVPLVAAYGVPGVTFRYGTERLIKQWLFLPTPADGGAGAAFGAGVR